MLARRLSWATALGGVLVAGSILAGVAVASGQYHRLYRALLYPVVAHRVTADAASTEAALLELNDFVYLNVRAPAGNTIIDDTAADILLRGFGVCDQADFALTRLANELDVPGRLVFLRQPDGVSPHSTAELFVQGDWRVFDPFYGVVPRDTSGEIATRAELATEPQLRPFSDLDPAWYQLAETVTMLDTATGVAGTVVGKFGEIAATLPDTVIDALQDAYLALPPPRYTDTDAEPVQEFETPDARLYYIARNYQVFRRTSEAAGLYEALVAQHPNSEYADDAVYELGVLALESDDANGTIEHMETLRAEYPDSPWRDESQYLEARASQALGDCEHARDLFSVVEERGGNGSEEAREQLAQLDCA